MMASSGAGAGGGAGDGRESPDLFEEEEEFSDPLNCCEEDSREEWPAEEATSQNFNPDNVNFGGGSLDPSPAAPMYRIGLNDNKAGMEGLDKAKINQIILEASKGSKYYENQIKRERQVSQRIEHMLKQLKTITPAQREVALKAADRELEALEAARDVTRIIVHIDMDAFYASVEMRDDPRLRDIPMGVGGQSMLSTSNYHARRYGVRAAMPGFIGKKLCPDLVIVPLRFAKYREASGQVREILARYDPHFSPVGLDESYLDLTDFVRLKIQQNLSAICSAAGASETELQGESPSTEEHKCVIDATLENSAWQCAEEVVEGMRKEIHERTGLTASAGLAPNMMLAKVASDMNKPNGQYTVSPTRSAVLEFVQKLPVRKINGIGKVTERMLNALGVATCGDLHRQRAVLRLLFSHTSSSHFLRVCIGLGSAHVHREYDRKSMSTERTFAEVSSAAELQQKCRELCQDLSQDMHRDSIKGRTVTLKLKTVHFEVKTHATTLPHSVSSPDDLYRAVSELLTAQIKACAPTPLRLRLMGVRISSLQSREEGGGSRGKGKQETLDGFVKQPSTVEVVGGSDVSTVQCPICGRVLAETDTDYRTINMHIDECLNRSAIDSITDEARRDTQSPRKNTASLSSSSPHKAEGATRRGRGRKGGAGVERRAAMTGTSGSRKRQIPTAGSKIEGELGEDPEPMKRRKTLDYFWK